MIFLYMIRIESLTKTFDDVVAVNNISFDIKDNEILGLLGPNGAGKTTTMRVITTFMSPTKGKIFIDGKDIFENTQQIKSSIGYLPENNPLYEDMSVYEYLRFVAESRNVENVNTRIKEIIGICKIQDVLVKNISELSKGYRQRVGFASAIIHNPKILILDEPTAGLDPNQAHEVRQLIKEFKKDKTVILSTHILSEVEEVADRVIIIHKGSIVAQGNIDELHSLVFKKNVVRFGGRFNRDLIDYLPSVISGIYSVKLISEYDMFREYEIETGSEIDIREQLFKLAVSENWTITELHRVSVSLENIFHELTKE